ncbi:MAG: ribosome assembly RNA-binding protein YhbY [Alphaproteobacteria bacterium CG_4_10_14_0_2_um_filter_63_37]|nr:MAG: hypothetical protein AUJ55_11845 [Proteobacteria bacterium CG1_02_64_396]PJA24194.1 MAG: ribosome assembly RNA-binding protein YhbY [Alphaproteobacteria bacterium CG_4_10_14_0_2_um_filter_63_37]
MYTQSGSERHALRSRAHGLKPVVIIGTKGLTPEVVKAIDEALAHHQLIKVKLPPAAEREEDLIEQIADQLKAETVQTVGRIAVLYRPKPEENKR